MKKKIFSVVLAVSMLLSQFGTMAFAEDGGLPDGITIGTSGLCEHHTEHDEGCGYLEGENPCSFVCELCDPQDSGPVPQPECVCDALCTEDGINAQCPVCGEDWDLCEGAEAAESCLCTEPCAEDGVNLDCHICGVEGADLGLCEGEQEMTACLCTKACAEGSINPDCPICGGEGADLGQCKGEVDAITVEKVQELIDALPALEDAAEDDFEAVQAAYNAYEALSEEEKQLVPNELLAKLEALRALFTPMLLNMATQADGAEVRYSTDGGSTWKEDSLSEALYNCFNAPSAKIELLRDIVTDSSWSSGIIVYPGTVTLDGKGYTISRGQVGGLLFNVAGTLTLTNITIDGGAVWNGSDPATRTNEGFSQNGGTGHMFRVSQMMTGYDSTLILGDGAVLRNNDLGENSYGAAVLVGNGSGSSPGTLIMKDGSKIINNQTRSGGAVLVDSGCSFVMKGGEISGNYATNGGGAVYVNSSGEFTMEGGEISGNYATSGGGAVYVGTSGEFIMEDGEISGNASGNNGGAVYAAGKFTMEDGSIVQNRSSLGGGGVSAFNGAVELKGGSISNNTITGSMGGGVLVDGNGSLSVSGDAKVIGNTRNENTSNNIYLSRGKQITIAGALNGAEFGVTTEALPDASNNVIITGSNATDYSSYFSSDNFSYSITNGDTNTVQLNNVVQKYTITYDANGGTGTVPQPSEQPKGESFTIPATTLTKDGHTFMGWSTEANYRFQKWNLSEDHPDYNKFYPITANPDTQYTHLYTDTTLYAVWAENVLTVTKDGVKKGDYPILEMAFGSSSGGNAIEGGSVITVQKSYTDLESAMFGDEDSGIAVTLDLNGKTISGAGSLYSGGSLKITGNGVYEGKLIQTGGELTIENGTFGGLLIQGGTADIQSGTFNGMEMIGEGIQPGIALVGTDADTAKAALEALLAGKKVTGSDTEIQIISGDGYSAAYILGPMTIGNKGGVNLTLEASKTTGVTYGDSVTYTATVSKVDTADTDTLSGSLSFYLGDPATGGEKLSEVNALTGSVMLDKSKLTAGERTIFAVFSGNSWFAESKQSVTTNVAKKQLTWDASQLTAAKKAGDEAEATVYGELKLTGFADGEEDTVTFTKPAEMKTRGFTEKEANKTQIVSVVPENGSWTFTSPTPDNYILPVGDPQITAKVNAVEPVETPSEVQTPTDPTEQIKVEKEEGISTVPDALASNPALDTPAKIEEAIQATVLEQLPSGTSAENIEVYDVKLMVSKNGGATWEEASKDHWPNDGNLTVTLPYPEGTGQNTHKFTVAHMFTSDAFNKTPGTFEYPAVTNTATGIKFTVTGFSPISVGWKEVTPSGGNGGSSGSSSGSGGSYRDDEYDFWQSVREKIEDAKPGDTIKANARGYDRMPWNVMEALRKAKGVTLHITWNGGEDIIIPSEAALQESLRIYYPLSYLEELDFTTKGQVDPSKLNPETGGVWEVDAPVAADNLLTPSGAPEITHPQRGLADTPELAEKGVEKAIPDLYEPETTPAANLTQTSNKGGMGVLLIAVVLLLAAGAGGFWFWKRRKA